MKEVKLVYLLPVLLSVAVISAAVGFSFGNTQKSSTSNGNGKLVTSPLFKVQTATTLGEVVKLEGNMLTIKDDKGQQDQFVASPNVVIYTPPKEEKPATPSSDLNTIQLNKKSTIQLQLVNDRFQVISISYTP